MGMIGFDARTSDDDVAAFVAQNERAVLSTWRNAVHLIDANKVQEPTWMKLDDLRHHPFDLVIDSNRAYFALGAGGVHTVALAQ